MSPETIKKLQEAKHRLAEEYGVSRLGVFGSCARGDERDDSDMDILVEFMTAPDLFEFFEIEEYLENKLGRKIDLVREQALKSQIKEEVMKEVVFI